MKKQNTTGTPATSEKEPSKVERLKAIHDEAFRLGRLDIALQCSIELSNLGY